MWRIGETVRKKGVREALRFGIVGVVATGLHYGIYLVLLAWMNESLAYTIGYVVSFVMNYYLTAHFTFRKKSSVKNGIGFVGSHAVNYVLHIVLLNVFIGIGISERLAPIPVYCIAVPVNFMLVRLVFKRL